MDYLAFGFSDGVGSRSSLSLQNGDQPIERRTSRLWINKLTGRVDDEPASLPARPNRLDARDVAGGPSADAAAHAAPDAPRGDADEAAGARRAVAPGLRRGGAALILIDY